MNFLQPANHKTRLQSPSAGIIKQILAHNIGRVVQMLGGSRSKSGEAINHAVGLKLLVGVGDTIEQGRRVNTFTTNVL